MRVGAPDHREAKRVHPDLCLQQESVLKGCPRITSRVHRRSRLLNPKNIRLVPSLVVREFIIRRQEWVRFAVPLDLRHLHDRLITRTRRRVRCVDRVPVRILDGEHASVTQVRVMRNRKCFAARLCFILRKEVPEPFRRITMYRRERKDLLGLVRPVSKQDIAMKIIAARRRAPLVAHDRCETTRLVHAFGDIDHFIPNEPLQVFILGHGIAV